MEEEKRDEKKKKKVRESNMREKGSRNLNVDGSMEEIIKTSEKHSEKKNKEKGKNGENQDSTEVEKIEEANLEALMDEENKLEKKKKKKKKEKKKESRNEEAASSFLPEFLSKGSDDMNSKVQKEGKSSNIMKADKTSTELVMNGDEKKKRKKDRKLNAEKDVIEKVPDDVEKRIGNIQESEAESAEDAKGNKIAVDKHSDKEAADIEQSMESGGKKVKRKVTNGTAKSEKDGNKTGKKLKDVLSTQDISSAEGVSDAIPSGTDASDRKRKRKSKKEKEGAANSLGISSGEISKEKGDKQNLKDHRAAKRKKGNEASNVSNEKCSSDSKISRSKIKSRRVSFSGEVEVFPSIDDTDNKECDDDGMVRGKRFSLEEDELVKEAVLKYIETNQLGEEGLHMVLHCKAYPQVKSCWKEIGASLPWRPVEAVYYRAHILFERSEKRKWEPEEYEMIQRFYEEHGPKWRTLADALGKQRIHVKDTWRRIRYPNRRKGTWSQEEYQSLFDLVNLDLRLKVYEEKKTKHGMLRENISWEAISHKLSTRRMKDCCIQWYDRLQSPLVKKELWANSDDYQLIDALQNQDACCVDDVEWDSLLEHRPGDICRKRWEEMVRHIGGNRERPFIEQVDVLSKRYCLEMLEYRK